MSTLTQLVKTIATDANGGNAELATLLQAWLAANPAIIIQDVDWYRPLSTFAAEFQRLRISYLAASAGALGLTYRALFYQGSAAQGDAQAQFNAAFTGGLAIVPDFIIDVTEPNRARLDEDTIVVIGPVTAPSLLGDNRSVFIAQPAADIATRTSGACSIIGPDGAIIATGIQVLNVSNVRTWPANQRNYVVLDETSGTLMGIPPCAATSTPWVAPGATTTTAYPCPTILQVTPPVGA